MEQIAKKVKADSWRVERSLKGCELLGLRYSPPFHDCYYNKTAIFEVTPDNPLAIYEKTLRAFAENSTFGAAVVFKKDDYSTLMPLAWCVLDAEFVTLESGTGLVHELPAFGEVDFNLWKERNDSCLPVMPLFCAVAPDGKFTADAGPKYAGRWVKDCDKDIIRDLKDRGLLLHHETYRHDYPFCWARRAGPAHSVSAQELVHPHDAVQG